MKRRAALLGLGLISGQAAMASQLYELRPVDEEHLMLVYRDAWVHHEETPDAPGWMQGHESRSSDRIETFGEPLNLTAAALPGSFKITSANDPGFAMAVSPAQVHRKTKVSGTAWNWPDPDLTYEHTLFLKLPRKLMQGGEYRLEISPATQSDKTAHAFTFDVFQHHSEAVHTSLIGYHPADPSKAADLYMWMGDGGARDYASFVGRRVWMVNDETGSREEAGRVAFWKPSADDFQGWNLTASDVWTADFDSFNKPGRWRVAIEGVGSSAPFEIKADAYREAFQASTRGFYYMRIGEPVDAMSPPPRQPRFIPGQHPEGFTIYLTTYSPWHPDWKARQGDQWDVKDWSKYIEPGRPTNPNARGGHSDALDWDRHLGHISIIWDLLLTYVITNGGGGEDDLGIRESGNGIPDVIDEAQNEVDFWLSLRDTKGGYATGLNNPSQEHKVMYQAAARPYMAWANAANAAMLAEAFRIAGKPELTAKYRDAALEAWGIANGEDLEEKFSIGNGATTGRDLKHLAAACLYSVTGEARFLQAFTEASVVRSIEDNTEQQDQFNQLYGTAVYLAMQRHNPRPVRTEAVGEVMLKALTREAMEKNVIPSETRPSRRATDQAFGWFQSIQEVQKAIVAHCFSPKGEARTRLHRALVLEAGWGLGRNPLNATQMTGLGSRFPDQIYTSGRNDGVPGVHPGHTPYMNSEPWGEGFMANPRYYASRGYPEWEQWPHGEALWRAPYSYSNNEFTPQQAMRGKHALLAYLHSMGG